MNSYPSTTLMLTEIRNIPVISTPLDFERFRQLLGDGDCRVSTSGMQFKRSPNAGSVRGLRRPRGDPAPMGKVDRLSLRINALTARRHPNIVAAALANITARFAGALLRIRTDYQPDLVNGRSS